MKFLNVYHNHMCVCDIIQMFFNVECIFVICSGKRLSNMSSITTLVFRILNISKSHPLTVWMPTAYLCIDIYGRRDDIRWDQEYYCMLGCTSHIVFNKTRSNGTHFFLPFTFFFDSRTKFRKLSLLCPHTHNTWTLYLRVHCTSSFVWINLA